MYLVDETALHIYTDGSSYSGPRAGGFAIRYLWINEHGVEETYDEAPLGYAGATNQQMELQACIHALQLIERGKVPFDINNMSRIFIYTDSRYITDNNSRALFEWSTHHWMKRDGNPVLNAHLWKELVRLIYKVRKRVEFKWVKGHSKDLNNKAVDKLAKQSAKQGTKQRISVVNVRKKKAAKTTEIGSVSMQGQKCTIYIIQDEYLKLQKLYRYRYQVMSKKSPYYKNIDFIFSNILLSAGHTYYVLLNSDQTMPRIAKVYKETSKLKKDLVNTP